jgi:uncharacterized protein (DUF2147 family)
MFEAMKRVRRWRLPRLAGAAVAGTALLGGVTLCAATVAGAKSAPNTFTFTGAYSGTLKLTPSNLDCSWGKTYNGKSYLVTLSHMKGTISGAGPGMWTVTAYVAKKGKNYVAKANVHSISDTSFQSNVVPIISFYETSGTVTFNGSKGSMDISVVYHAIGSTSYGGSATVTGSWNCPNGLNLS